MPLGNPSGPFIGDSTWKREFEQRAASVEQTLNIIVGNDFETNSMADTRVDGTGTVTYDTGLTGGVARLKTGAAALGANALVYNSGGVQLVGSPLNEPWYVEARCAIQNTPSNKTDYDCIALQDSFTGGAREYISFGLYGSYDTTYLILILDKGGSITTYLASVAADIGNFHYYGIGRDIVNDKLYALVDGAPVLEVDGPFANLTANPCFSYSHAGTQVLGQNVEMWVDCIGAGMKRVS